jgi:hypothetical protein
MQAVKAAVSAGRVRVARDRSPAQAVVDFSDDAGVFPPAALIPGVTRANAARETTKKWVKVQGRYAGAAVRRSSRVQCEINVLVQAAQFGALDALSAAFKLEVTSADLSGLDAELNAFESGAALADRIADLRRKLASFLMTGQISWLVTRPGEGDDANEDWASPVRMALLELARADLDESAIAVVDDRNLAGYRQVDRAMTMSSFDVMATLVEMKALSEAQRRDAWQKLADAGCRFVPYDVDAIANELARADQDATGRIVATPFLAITKQRLAQDLQLLREVALIFPPESGRKPELLGITRILRLAGECIVAAWKSAPALDRCAIASSWIWDELRIGGLGAETPEGPNVDVQLRIHSLSYLTVALALADVDDGRAPAMFDWLWQQVRAREFIAAPELRGVIRDQVKELWLKRDGFDDFVREHPDFTEADVSAFWRRQAQESILAMPVEMQELFAEDEEIAAALALTRDRSVTVQNRVYQLKPLVAATEQLTNANDEAPVRSSTDGSLAHVMLRDNGSVSIRTPEGALGQLFYPLQRTLIVGDAIEQREAVRLVFEAHTLAPEKARAMEDEILALSGALDRIEHLDEMVEGSWVGRLEKLQAAARSRDGVVKQMCAPPDWPEVRGRFRVADNASAEEDVTTLTERLVREIGSRKTVERLSGVPCDLPKVLAAIDGDDADRFGKWVARSPLGSAWALRNVARSHQWAQEDVVAAIERAADGVVPLVKLARWSLRSMGENATYKGVSDRWKLIAAWAWADGLWRAVEGTRVSLPAWTEWLDDRGTGIVGAIAAASIFDIANPTTVPESRLLLCALEGALDRDGVAAVLRPRRSDKRLVASAIQDWRSAPDRLGSFLAKSPKGLIAGIAGVPPKPTKAAIEAMVAAYERAPRGKGAVNFVMYGPHALGAAQLKRVLRVLTANIEKSRDVSGDAALAGFCATGLRQHKTSVDAGLEAMRAFCNALSRNSAVPEDELIRHVARALDSALMLCLSKANQLWPESLADFLTSLDLSPRLTAQLESCAQASAEGAPWGHGGKLWRVAIDTRARAS